MLKAAMASARHSGRRRMVSIKRLAKRVERSVWSLLMASLCPAVVTLMAAIAGVVACAVLTPAATLEPHLLFSLLLVLFVLVMATVLLGTDAESGRRLGPTRSCRPPRSTS